MDTEHILNEKIILLLEKLTNDHPELINFLDEIDEEYQKKKENYRYNLSDL